jgi:hypothetical protein
MEVGSRSKVNQEEKSGQSGLGLRFGKQALSRKYDKWAPAAKLTRTVVIRIGYY